MSTNISLSICAYIVSLFLIGCANEKSEPKAESSVLPKSLEQLIQESVSGRSWVESCGLGDAKAPRIPMDDAAVAMRYIEMHPDYRSFHLLMMLNKQYQVLFTDLPEETKAAVLASWLAHVTFYNEWGHLPGPDGELAEMLRSTGTIAVKKLKPLLDDNKPAYWFGSSDSTYSRQVKYRVCDFAFRYICLLLGEDPLFSESVKVRDQNIENLKSRI